MFEEYLQDASAFFDEGRSAAECGDIKKSRRYYRGAVFYTFSAMEAYVNFIADTFEKGGNFEGGLQKRRLYLENSRNDVKPSC